MAWLPPEDAGEPESPFEEPGSGGTPGSATSDSREWPAFVGSSVPSRVHVVEPDSLYRHLFARTLVTAGLDVRTYTSAAEFLAAVGPDEPGCLLFSARKSTSADAGQGQAGESALPEDFEATIAPPTAPKSDHHSERDVSVGELLRRLAANESPLAAIAVATDLSLEPALRLLRRGATDVLEKPFKRSELLAAVREALVISARRRDRRLALLRLARLSERQYRLLGLLTSPWPRWVIALRLGVRRRELLDHTEEIVRLLGVASVAEAMDVFHDVNRNVSPHPSSTRRWRPGRRKKRTSSE